MFQSIISAIGIPVLLSYLEKSVSDTKTQSSLEVASKISEARKALEISDISNNDILNNLNSIEEIRLIEAGLQEKMIDEIHKSYRAELASQDKFISRMRPTFGYVLALSWTLQMGVIVYILLTEPARASEVIASFGSLTTMWSVALSVLGVYVYKRSQEKQTLNNNIDSILSKVTKKLFS